MVNIHSNFREEHSCLQKLKSITFPTTVLYSYKTASVSAALKNSFRPVLPLWVQLYLQGGLQDSFLDKMSLQGFIDV